MKILDQVNNIDERIFYFLYKKIQPALGYVERTRKVLAGCRRMRDEVKKIPGLRVIGDPGLCICSFTSDEFDIYAVLSEMRKHGWTMGAMQFPPAVHLDITHLTTQNGVLEDYLSVSQKYSNYRKKLR